MANTIVLHNLKTGQDGRLCYTCVNDDIIAILDMGQSNIISFRIPLAPIRNAVMQKLNNTVGWSWSSIKKSAAKISSKVGNKKLLLRVKRIMDDPRFTKGAIAAGVIFPPFGITYGMTKSAVYLVDAASEGDPKALSNIAKIKQKALAGDLDSAKVVRAMATMYSAKKKGADISGWADNLKPRKIKPDNKSLLTRFYNAGVIEVSAR